MEQSARRLFYNWFQARPRALTALRLSNKVLTVLAESAELAEDIDTARAQAAKERAEKRMASQADDVDHARAEAALLRAVERLHVAQLR